MISDEDALVLLQDEIAERWPGIKISIDTAKCTIVARTGNLCAEVRVRVEVSSLQLYPGLVSKKADSICARLKDQLWQILRVEGVTDQNRGFPVTTGGQAKP